MEKIQMTSVSHIRLLVPRDGPVVRCHWCLSHFRAYRDLLHITLQGHRQIDPDRSVLNKRSEPTTGRSGNVVTPADCEPVVAVHPYSFLSKTSILPLVIQDDYLYNRLVLDPLINHIVVYFRRTWNSTWTCLFRTNINWFWMFCVSTLYFFPNQYFLISFFQVVNEHVVIKSKLHPIFLLVF